MKFYSINFQPIVNEKCGNALIHYIFKTFCQLDENYIFLTSTIDRDYGNNIVGHSRIVGIFIKILTMLAQKFHIPYYLIRSWSEIIVDYQHYLYLKKQDAPYILMTSMYSRRCTKLAKKLGCKTILIAGNLNDELYYNVVTIEKKRLGLNYTDVYSSKFRIGIYKEMMENLDEVWVNSIFSAQTFGSKKTTVIPISFYETRGYAPKIYSHSEKSDIIIGYFGHTTLLKGVHLLAEAISKCKYRNSIKLVLAGSLDQYVSGLLANMDINIQYMGFVPESEKEGLIKTFDLLAIPSLYDAGPTTIYEGCECNVPLLVSDGCGGSELIKNNKGCIIFKTMNLDDLIKSIETFYENRNFYERVGSYMEETFGAQGILNNFDVLKQAINLYEIHN